MGILSGMKWYDYIWAPWALTKMAYVAWKNMQPPKPGRIPQTSCYGRVLPLVWGKTRITGNVIYRAEEPTEVAFGVAGAVFPTLVAVCEGEIAGFARVWRNGKVISGLLAAKYGNYQFNGTRPTQTAWTAMPSGKDLGYPGVALVGVSFKMISDEIGQWSFEVKGRLHATGDATTGDADPSQVIADALGSGYYAANFTPTVNTATGVDGMAASSYARWVAAMSLWISPAWTEQKPVAEHIRDVLDSTWSDALWSDGKLQIVPLGDQTVVGSVTFTPYTGVRYALTATDLIRDGDTDPVEVTRGSESDVYNTAPVAFLDRASSAGSDAAYNETTVEDSDPYHSQTYGLKRASRVVYDSVCLRDVAVKLARLRAQRWVQQRNSYTFAIPWRFCRIEPFDLITLPVAGETRTVKVLAVKESDSHTSLEIEAEDWIAGANTALAYETQSSEGITSSILDIQSQAHATAARNWTPGSIDYWVASVVWHPGSQRFIIAPVANPDPVPTLLWATDGREWTLPSSTLPASFNGWRLASDGTSVVAYGYNADATSVLAYWSDDGDTWTASSTGTLYYADAIAACGTGCFVGPGLATYFVRSTDAGHTWGTVSVSFSWVAGTVTLAYSPDTGRIVASGYYTGVGYMSTYSDDQGATWSIPAVTGYSVQAYGNGTFVGVGASGVAATSPDGVTWTAVSPAPFGSYQGAVSFTGRLFVASFIVGTEIGIRTSSDGRTWDETTVHYLGDVGPMMAWGPERGVMVNGRSYVSGQVSVF